jgi:integrase/recombinase XerC
MTVFRRPGKKESWVFEFQLHGHRVKRGGFPSEDIATQAETVARARIIDVRLEREYGIRPPRGRIPLLRAYITETYLPDIKGRLSPSTYHSHRRLLTNLSAVLGMHRVSDLTQSQLTAYRTERAKTLAANSLRLEFARIRQFFRHVLAAGYLHTNPAAGVGLPRETRGPDRILTEDEQVKLLAACWTQTARDMIEFSLWTALRPGELCGLIGSMVDLVGARILVPQPKVEKPKVIPLMPEAVAILLRQPPLESGAAVFHGAFRGKRVRENVYRRAFKTAVTKAGIPPIRPNDLRHSVAVRLIRAGADLATVGDLLGHRAPYRTTARYLAHTNEDRKREVLKKLSIPPRSRRKSVAVKQPK